MPFGLGEESKPLIDENSVPDINDGELTARFIFRRSHIRSDMTIKPDAFMPPANLEMSVTRHLFAGENELWIIGRHIAETTKRMLRGRGDVYAYVYRANHLDIFKDPIPENPHHANVLEWPSDKPSQKAIAQKIASTSAYRGVS